MIIKKFFYIDFLLTILLLFGVSVSITSCNNSMQTMLDDYNKHFLPAETDIDPILPGEEGFIESNMLFSQYTVCEDGSVNLSAPESSSYKWVITNKNKEPITNISFYNKSGYRNKDFRFYLPKNNIKVGSYTISLTVTDSEKNEYSDSCLLIVYEKLK